MTTLIEVHTQISKDDILEGLYWLTAKEQVEFVVALDERIGDCEVTKQLYTYFKEEMENICNE
jgi:hypothetical protein